MCPAGSYYTRDLSVPIRVMSSHLAYILPVNMQPQCLTTLRLSEDTDSTLDTLWSALGLCQWQSLLPQQSVWWHSASTSDSHRPTVSVVTQCQHLWQSQTHRLGGSLVSITSVCRRRAKYHYLSHIHKTHLSSTVKLIQSLSYSWLAKHCMSSLQHDSGFDAERATQDSVFPERRREETNIRCTSRNIRLGNKSKYRMETYIFHPDSSNKVKTWHSNLIWKKENSC